MGTTLRNELLLYGFCCWHATYSKNTWLPLTVVACSNQGFQLIEPFPYLICAIHLKTSHQFVASDFSTTLVIKIHGSLYIFLVVTSLEYIVTIHNTTNNLVLY